MKTSRVEAVNKIAIKGDRNEPIIVAIQNIQIKHPELYKELAKVIDYELWDGYSLSIHEEGNEVKYKIEVFNNGKLHIEHSATSKEHLMQIWKGFFPLYEGWEYRVIDITDNDVIIEGAMDNGDLEVLENLKGCYLPNSNDSFVKGNDADKAIKEAKMEVLKQFIGACCKIREKESWQKEHPFTIYELIDIAEKLEIEEGFIDEKNWRNEVKNELRCNDLA